MRERRQIEPEQGLRFQEKDARGTFQQYTLADDAEVAERRQQQRIGPCQNADAETGEGAACGGPAPDHAAEKRRSELRNRSKGKQADRGKLGFPRQPVIGIGQAENGQDGGA